MALQRSACRPITRDTMSFASGHARFPAGDPSDPRGALPTTPPPDAAAAVDRAWERVAHLADENRELHFDVDGATGRVIIELRSLDGTVLEIVAPSRALAVMAGQAL